MPRVKRPPRASPRDRVPQFADCGHTRTRIAGGFNEQAEAVSFGSDLMERGGRNQGLAGVPRVEKTLERWESVLRLGPNISQGPDRANVRGGITKRLDERRHGSPRFGAKVV